jgi:hypothetical protein
MHMTVAGQRLGKHGPRVMLSKIGHLLLGNETTDMYSSTAKEK